MAPRPARGRAVGPPGRGDPGRRSGHREASVSLLWWPTRAQCLAMFGTSLSRGARRILRIVHVAILISLTVTGTTTNALAALPGTPAPAVSAPVQAPPPDTSASATPPDESLPSPPLDPMNVPPSAMGLPANAASASSMMEQPPVRQAPIFEKWWFWTAIAAIAVTTVVIVATSSGPSAPRTDLGNMTAF